MKSEESGMSERLLALNEPSKNAEGEFWIRSLIGDKKLEDEYLLGDIIGRGNSSVVYKCLRKGRTEWACKVLKKKQLNKKSVQTHIRTLHKLKHPNIIHLKDVFETNDEIQLILELAQGGELFERIVDRGQYSEEDASQVVRQILNALQYLHHNNIIHNDLKPENLLFQTEVEDSILKVADYGMKELLTEDHISSRSCSAFGYSAPEVLLNNKIDSSVDLWSLGVIIYIMLCGFEPFWDDAGEAAMSKKIIECKYSFPSPWWDEISGSAKELISQLLSVNPKSRPTAEEVLNHPWALGISTCSLHMNQTILRLREFNAKTRFRVATKAVLATCRALNLLSPGRKAHSEEKTVDKCFCSKPKDGRSESKYNGNSDVNICCECSLIGSSASEDSNESLLSLPIDGKHIGKTPSKLAKELSSQYKGKYVGLG